MQKLSPSSTGSFYFSAAITLALAQISSMLIHRGLGVGRSSEIFPFLYFTHVRNTGGIFGLFQGKGWVFAVVSVLFLAGLVVFIMRTKGIRRFEYICYGLIVGGGLSNILDRLIYGSVIDFIDVRGIQFWHYIFNTADVAIHLGVWPLVISGLFGIKHRKPAPAAEAPPEGAA